MKAYSFHEGEIPKGFNIDFESYLFNRQQHRITQGEHWKSFHLVKKEKKCIKASIHFYLDKNIARSPHKASFGSIEFSEEVPLQDLFTFYERVEDQLRAHGIKRILIKNPPQGYSASKASTQHLLFFHHGFQVSLAELTSLLSVGGKFEERIEKWEQRKLKQAVKHGLRFREVPITTIETIYHFIAQCRQERGQSLSMTLAEVLKVANACQDDVILFAAYKEKELTAASIAIRVHKNILYNFYSGHPKKFDALSPVVLLLRGMYNWCDRHQVQLIDLGTSMLNGKPNYSLLEFKGRIGGIPSLKLTFEKDLVS